VVFAIDHVLRVVFYVRSHDFEFSLEISGKMGYFVSVYGYAH
jgi:hypothetical protein